MRNFIKILIAGLLFLALYAPPEMSPQAFACTPDQPALVAAVPDQVAVVAELDIGPFVAPVLQFEPVALCGRLYRPVLTTELAVQSTAYLSYRQDTKQKSTKPTYDARMGSINNHLLRQVNAPPTVQAGFITGLFAKQKETAPDELNPAPDDGNFVTNNWIELLLGVLAFVEIVVRLTPTKKDDSAFKWIKSLLNFIIPSLKKGGGSFGNS